MITSCHLANWSWNLLHLFCKSSCLPCNTTVYRWHTNWTYLMYSVDCTSNITAQQRIPNTEVFIKCEMSHIGHLLLVHVRAAVHRSCGYVLDDCIWNAFIFMELANFKHSVNTPKISVGCSDRIVDTWSCILDASHSQVPRHATQMNQVKVPEEHVTTDDSAPLSVCH